MSLSSEQRAKLNYAFAHHVITTFLNSKARYVQPFLEPVDAHDAPDYHDVIKHPMDLSTILKELESGKYTDLSDVKASFSLMFSNCSLYNPSTSVSGVYLKGCSFRRAFHTLWDKKTSWIKAQAAKLSDSSEEGLVDGNSENVLHDDEHLAIHNEDDGVIQEDDGTSRRDRTPVRRSRRTSRKNELTNNNIINKFSKAARKKDGGKYLVAARNTARNHDIPPKRTRLARKSAVRGTVQDHIRDSTESSQDEQSLANERQAEHETQQSHPSPEPEENSSDADSTSTLDPLHVYLSKTITKQVDATAALIIDDANGEHTEHRRLIAQLCRNEENHDNFYQVWEQKAMDRVSRMLIQEILVGGIESEVNLALAEAVTEKTREHCVQMAGRARAFSRAFGGNGR